MQLDSPLAPNPPQHPAKTANQTNIKTISQSALFPTSALILKSSHRSCKLNAIYQSKSEAGVPQINMTITKLGLRTVLDLQRDAPATETVCRYPSSVLRLPSTVGLSEIIMLSTSTREFRRETVASPQVQRRRNSVTSPLYPIFPTYPNPYQLPTPNSRSYLYSMDHRCYEYIWWRNLDHLPRKPS